MPLLEKQRERRQGQLARGEDEPGVLGAPPPGRPLQPGEVSVDALQVPLDGLDAQQRGRDIQGGSPQFHALLLHQHPSDPIDQQWQGAIRGQAQVFQ